MEDGPLPISRSGLVDQGLKMGTIEIVERKSLEMRESFEVTRHEQTAKVWDRAVL